MLTSLAVANYRSLLDLVVPLNAVTLVTGPNGSGKSNLYRVHLEKELGETRIQGLKTVEMPPWHWPDD